MKIPRPPDILPKGARKETTSSSSLPTLEAGEVLVRQPGSYSPPPSFLKDYNNKCRRSISVWKRSARFYVAFSPGDLVSANLFSSFGGEGARSTLPSHRYHLNRFFSPLFKDWVGMQPSPVSASPPKQREKCKPLPSSRLKKCRSRLI